MNVNRLAQEIAELSHELPSADYYREFLQRVLAAFAASAGAVWLRTSEGELQAQSQINIEQIGLARAENGQRMHAELLREAAARAQPGFIMPHSVLGRSESGAQSLGNPTDYVMLLAPILYDNQVAGLVEVWQDLDQVRGGAPRSFLQFILRMAALTSGYAHKVLSGQGGGEEPFIGDKV